MKTFHIPVVWASTGTLVIEAENLDEAVKIAKDVNTDLPERGYYVQDSFKIDWDVLSETEGY